MRYSWVIGFSVFVELVIHSETHPPDEIGKTWMDRCDLRKMNLKPTETTTRRSKPTRISHILPLFAGPYDTNVGTRFYKVNKHKRVDISAAIQEVFKAIKDKLFKDAAERGSSIDFDEFDTDKRMEPEDIYGDGDNYQDPPEDAAQPMDTRFMPPEYSAIENN